MPTLLVFGARHLGRTIATELAREGWNAAAVARSEETIAALREALPEALGIVADAGRADEVERAFAEAGERFGRVDLVLNAITATPRGSFGGGSVVEAAPDALEPYVDELLPAIWNVVRVGSRVLVALLIVDATIESEKTAPFLSGRQAETSASEQDVARAVAYLAGQSPRGWTHELTITPRLDRWVP